MLVSCTRVRAVEPTQSSGFQQHQQIDAHKKDIEKGKTIKIITWRKKAEYMAAVLTTPWPAIHVSSWPGLTRKYPPFEDVSSASVKSPPYKVDVASKVVGREGASLDTRY